jgi:hypothetical protein
MVETGATREGDDPIPGVVAAPVVRSLTAGRVA